MRYIFLLSLLIFTVCSTRPSYDPEISATELEEYIRYLASEELNGRQPGTEGDEKAAAFIRSKFKSAGLELLGNNGYQSFDVAVGIELGKMNSLIVGDSSYKVNEDFAPLSFSGNGEVSADVAFAGYGFSIDSDTLVWDDYATIDVTDKWVMLFRADPDLDNIASPFAQFSTDRFKVMNAMDHGAAGVLLINTIDYDEDDKLEKLKPQREISTTKIPVLQIKRDVASHILNGSEKSLVELEAYYKNEYGPSSFVTNTTVKGSADLNTQTASTNNVVALLEGSSDEIIVMGAHFDHLGMGGESSRAPDTIAVHYGADDNASGTALLIEMAQKLANTRPAATILFIAFGAEEMGLLGSRYFVENPLVDMDKMKVMFNFDMVGRLNKENSLLISGTGTALETDSLLAIGIDSTAYAISKSPGGTGPSDHSSFYGEGIPVLFFSTGVHDQYHTPLDNADLINYSGMEKLGNSILNVFQHYDNQSLALTFQESQEPRQQGMRRRMKVTLGIVPDFANQVEGLGVSGVRPGGPAYNGGMKKGDIITGIDGKAVTNIYDYMFRMGTYDTDDRITVEVERDGQKKLLIIQL